MHRIFQSFIDRLGESTDASALRESMEQTAQALGLSCFAYLCLSDRGENSTQLVSTYPSAWTDHYLRNHYERYDPVILRALKDTEPFEWGLNPATRRLSEQQRELFAEAAKHGICSGFTIPIHDSRGPIAAVSFAADRAHAAALLRRATDQKRVLQLIAMYFHAHARRWLAPDRIVDGVRLSPREIECIRWAARGKSAWEIGSILGISRHTAATYLDSARAKLGVRTVVQLVARLVASGMMVQ